MSNSLIPKQIHYIWFGNGEKSELIQRCMKKTAEIMQGWDIKVWTEKEYDMDQCDYFKEAYNKGKYAFAADFARFDILYKHGGVYIDTDVELLKKIPDSFLKEKGFTGVEDNKKINPGLIFGVEPGNPIVKEIMDKYKEEHYLNEKGKVASPKTVVERTTEVFEKYGFKRNGEEQIVENIHIYPAEVFCAFDFISNEFSVTDNTISIHHYAATWTNKRRKIKLRFQDFLRKTIGIEKYKKVLNVKRKFFGIHGQD